MWRCIKYKGCKSNYEFDCETCHVDEINTLVDLVIRKGRARVSLLFFFVFNLTILKNPLRTVEKKGRFFFSFLCQNIICSQDQINTRI